MNRKLGSKEPENRQNLNFERGLLAVVQFYQPMHQALQKVHQEVLDGASIGIALRRDNWKIDKEALYFGSVSLSPQLQGWMKEQTSDSAALHIYKLVVSNGADHEPIHYCTIIEVHSPQYLDAQWLQALYSQEYDKLSVASEESKKLVGDLLTLIQQFPLPG